MRQAKSSTDTHATPSPVKQRAEEFPAQSCNKLWILLLKESDSVVFFIRFRFLQLICHHHLRKTPGFSSLLLGGGIYLRQTPQACVKAPASQETGVWPGGQKIQMGMLFNHLW